MKKNTLVKIKEARKAGIECVMSTGRSRAYPEKWYTQLGTSRYIISSGGSEVYDCKTKEILQDFPLDTQIAKILYNVAAKYNSLTPQERERISPLYAADNLRDTGLRIRFVGNGENATTILKDPKEESLLGKDGDKITFCNETNVVKDGKIIFDGTTVKVFDPEEFFNNTPIIQMMVGSNNRFVWKYMLDKIWPADERAVTPNDKMKRHNDNPKAITLPFYAKALVDETANRGNMVADVQVENTNKGEAAKFLYNLLDKPQMAMIGDANNDVEMAEVLRELNGISFAVGNTKDESLLNAVDFKLDATATDGAVGFAISEMLKAREYMQEYNIQQYAAR